MPKHDWPVVIAVCCREWPVALMMQMGRCGICKEVPVVQDPTKIITTVKVIL